MLSLTKAISAMYNLDVYVYIFVRVYHCARKKCDQYNKMKTKLNIVYFGCDKVGACMANRWPALVKPN